MEESHRCYEKMSTSNSTRIAMRKTMRQSCPRMPIFLSTLFIFFCAAASLHQHTHPHLEISFWNTLHSSTLLF